MPELAEVVYYCRQWQPSIGEVVRDVRIHPETRVFRAHGSARAAAKAAKELAGRRLQSARTHGKQMLFGFSEGRWLAVHLGMTGELSRVAGAEQVPRKHDHLTLDLEDGTMLVFHDPRQFGALSIEVTGDSGKDPDWWTDLPPGILTSAFTRDRVAEALRRHARSPLKPLLLDQAWFPGIGNWMADELLWRLRLPPPQLAGTLRNAPGSIAAFWRGIRTLCREALEVIGTDWGEPPDRWLFNHRWRDGGHCPRRQCRAALVRADLRGRTTCWCPQCQA